MGIVKGEALALSGSAIQPSKTLCPACDWTGHWNESHFPSDCAARQIAVAIAPLVKRIEALESRSHAPALNQVNGGEFEALRRRVDGLEDVRFDDGK